MAALASHVPFLLPHSGVTDWGWETLDKDDDTIQVKQAMPIKEQSSLRSSKSSNNMQPSSPTTDSTNSQKGHSTEYTHDRRRATADQSLTSSTNGQKRHSDATPTTITKRVKVEHPSSWEDTKPVIPPQDLKPVQAHVAGPYANGSRSSVLQGFTTRYRSTRSEVASPATSAGSRSGPFLIESDSEDEIVVARPPQTSSRKSRGMKLERGSAAWKAAQMQQSERLRRQALGKKHEAANGQQTLIPKIEPIAIGEHHSEMTSAKGASASVAKTTPSSCNGQVSEAEADRQSRLRREHASEELQTAQANKPRHEATMKAGKLLPSNATGTDSVDPDKVTSGANARATAQSAAMETELQQRMRRARAARDLQNLQAKLRAEANIKIEHHAGAPLQVAKADDEARRDATFAMANITNSKPEDVARDQAKLRKQREKAAADLDRLQAKLRAEARFRAAEEARLKEQEVDRQRRERKAEELRVEAHEAHRRQKAREAKDRARREEHDRTKREEDEQRRREADDRARREDEVTRIDQERKASEIRAREQIQRATEARRAAELRTTQESEQEAQREREAARVARLKFEAGTREDNVRVAEGRKGQAQLVTHEAGRKVGDATKKVHVPEPSSVDTPRAVPPTEISRLHQEPRVVDGNPGSAEERRENLAKRALERELAFATSIKPHTNIWRESPVDKRYCLNKTKAVVEQEEERFGVDGAGHGYQSGATNEIERKKQKRIEAMRHRNSRNRDVVDDTLQFSVVEEVKPPVLNGRHVAKTTASSSLGNNPFSLSSQASQAALARNRDYISPTARSPVSGSSCTDLPHEAPSKQERPPGRVHLEDVQLVWWRKNGVGWPEVIPLYEQATGRRLSRRSLATRQKVIETALDTGDPTVTTEYAKFVERNHQSIISVTRDSDHVDSMKLTSPVRDYQPVPRRPTTGGKTMDEETFRHILAELLESRNEDPQAEKESEAEEERFMEEDYRHFYYVVQRREVSSDELEQHVEIEDKPFLDCCTRQYSLLAAANKAAAQEARKARSDDIASIINDCAYTSERSDEDGLHQHRFDYRDVGKVDVRVHRRCRDARQRMTPKSMAGFISRTIWFVAKQTTLRSCEQIDASDDLFGESQSRDKDSTLVEELIEDTAYTEHGMALEFALDQAMKLGFQSTSTNLDQRDQEKQKMECELRQQFEEHGEATFELEDSEGQSSEIKIFVKEGCLRGARNL